MNKRTLPLLLTLTGCLITLSACIPDFKAHLKNEPTSSTTKKKIQKEVARPVLKTSLARHHQVQSLPLNPSQLMGSLKMPMRPLKIRFMRLVI